MSSGFDLLGSAVLLSVSFYSLSVVLICLPIICFHFHFPICLMKSLTVQYYVLDRTERGATAASKMALVSF